jgi:AcrR family transcriptional regulator
MGCPSPDITQAIIGRGHKWGLGSPNNSKVPEMTSCIRRDHLVDTALNLFSHYGFHATGIDRILAEAGVAKMTLYRHFKSKDELILAALCLRDELYRKWFMGEIERLAASPQDRLLALFNALEIWFKSNEFTGCCFNNAVAEFGDKNHPIHTAAAEHKRSVRDYIVNLTEAADATDPKVLADQLMMLMEGAIVSARVTGNAASARQAQSAAKVLIEQAISMSTS